MGIEGRAGPSSKYCAVRGGGGLGGFVRGRTEETVDGGTSAVSRRSDSRVENDDFEGEVDRDENAEEVEEFESVASID